MLEREAGRTLLSSHCPGVPICQVASEGPAPQPADSEPGSIWPAAGRAEVGQLGGALGSSQDREDSQHPGSPVAWPESVPFPACRGAFTVGMLQDSGEGTGLTLPVQSRPCLASTLTSRRQQGDNRRGCVRPQMGLPVSAGQHLGRRAGRWRELGSSGCGVPPWLCDAAARDSPPSRLLGLAVGGPADGGEAAAPPSPFPRITSFRHICDFGGLEKKRQS